jgi:exodeoxyribonuclease VIII
MTEKEYRAHPAISRSELFKISESPEKFKYYKDHPEEPTPSLVFGQLFHAMALLRPSEVWQQFAIVPNVDGRTKAGKEALAQFREENEGKTLVTYDMVKQAEAMCNALESNDFARKLLGGEREKEFFWTDDLTGEECKCRVDVLNKIGDKNVIVDLKSADCAETEAFIKSAIKYGYDFQSAMYIEGAKANTHKEYIFVFVVVEKKPPYSINILQADELVVLRGYDLFREYIGTYHECKKSGVWWGYLGKHNLINVMGLPSYLAKEIE